MSDQTVSDETADDIPVRDITLNPARAGIPVSLKDLLPSQNARARQAVAKISRKDLEDRFLHMEEENFLLKQHTYKQEDKIKRLAVKLIRLVKDRKRLEQPSSVGLVKAGRNVEMEEMIEDLQGKIHELEKQNNGLKQRLLVAQVQIQTQSRRPTRYAHIQSRINSGLRRFRKDTAVPPQQPITPRRNRQVEREMSSRPPQGLLRCYGQSRLDEARSEMRNLKNVIERQRTQMEEMERSAEMLREQLRLKEREYEESLLQLREPQTIGQRVNIMDNVDMIKLNKQLAEKENTLMMLEGRFLQIQKNQEILKASHDRAMAKVDELTEQLKEARLRNLDLENQLQTEALQETRMSELLEQIQDLEKERDLLKENYDKLMNRAFDILQNSNTRKKQLKLQIAQLEMALKSDLTEKNQILERIKIERDLHKKLLDENKELQLRNLEQKQQLDEMKDRMKFFTKASEVDAGELSEALMHIKVRKTQKTREMGVREKEEEEGRIDAEHSLKELQATYAETVQELEKTRNMLIIQQKINKDYQAKVAAVMQRMNSLNLESKHQQKKAPQLLDLGTAKKKKHAHLKDNAYRARVHILGDEITDQDVADKFDGKEHRAEGENLLEIHLGTARFSPEALDSLGDKDPSTFCTYGFYDFELQSTAVVRGPEPVYDFTSRYLVKVDDLFLHYIHSSSITVEAHLAEGLNFRTIAAGQISLSQMGERDGNVFGTMQLVGVTGVNRVFGTLDYWLRLRVPMERDICLYTERVNAFGDLNPSGKDQNQETGSVVEMDQTPAETAGRK